MGTASAPLYLTIAQSIRNRIVAGDLPPGTSLASLRAAADEWGVNLHTVRHAYAALEREGLLKIGRGRQGTRVVGAQGSMQCPAGSQNLAGADEAVAAYIDGVIRRAERDHGLTPPALSAAIEARLANSRLPRVHFLECTYLQAEHHAAEIRSRFAVDARPWCLHGPEPPPGPLLTTYFHLADVGRAWPDRVTDLGGISIRPDPGLRRKLASSREILVCEFDEPTARALAADLESLAPSGARIDIKLADHPEQFLDDPRDDRLHLMPPRVWYNVPASDRQDERSAQLLYRLDPGELRNLGRRLGWPSGAP